MVEIVFKEESYKIIGACFEVYKEMGCGFVESVYQECMELELRLQSIPYVPQPKLELVYKNQRLQQTYRPDFICYSKIVVEIKALERLSDIERAQLHNYLHATRFRLGLLVNFGYYPQLEFERIVL